MGYWRHAAFGVGLRLLLAARTIQHSIDDVEKSHFHLLNAPVVATIQRSRGEKRLQNSAGTFRSPPMSGRADVAGKCARPSGALPAHLGCQRSDHE